MAHLTGVYTFDYFELLGTTMSSSTAMLIMLGFLAAFLVKLPVVPLHNWLPDAHTEAPTAGSLILAALLLKTGAYGLLRFIVPLFPAESVTFAPVGMLLGVAGILYGAKLAFAQTDLKRLVAYTSVSHMGFIILGVFSFNELAYQGVVIQMVAHGISTGALFVLVGQLYERIHTLDLNKMGGLWEKVPVMGSMVLIFSMASLGLPGLGNFIAELLILIGAFKVNILMSCLASLGLVAATIYSLRIVQKVFLGNKNTDWKMNDLTIREKMVSALLVIAIVWLGLFPKPVLNTAKPAILKTLNKQKEISYVYPGSNSDKILSDPSYNPLCTLVVKNNSFKHKGTLSKAQSYTKEGQDNLMPLKYDRKRFFVFDSLHDHSHSSNSDYDCNFYYEKL